MNMGKYIKKRMIFFCVSFLFVIVCSVAASFSFMNSNFVNNDIVINNENLQIIYENGKKGIQKSLYPLSFQQGNLKSPSNIIKIVNKGHFSTNFAIVIKQTDVSIDNIDINKIYYSVNNSTPNILGKARNGEIFSSTLAADSEFIVDVKLWISSEFIENDDAGKKIALEFDVIKK